MEVAVDMEEEVVEVVAMAAVNSEDSGVVVSWVE